MDKYLEQLRNAPNNTAVLPVTVESNLVKAGKAVKTDRTGCGRAKAEYRLV